MSRRASWAVISPTIGIHSVSILRSTRQRRIIPAVSSTTHALAHAVTPEPLATLATAVLRALVGMEPQPLRPATLLASHVQRLDQQVRVRPRTLSRAICSPCSRSTDTRLRLPAAPRLCVNSSLTRLRNRRRSTSGVRRLRRYCPGISAFVCGPTPLPPSDRQAAISLSPRSSTKAAASRLDSVEKEGECRDLHGATPLFRVNPGKREPQPDGSRFTVMAEKKQYRKSALPISSVNWPNLMPIVMVASVFQYLSA